MQTRKFADGIYLMVGKWWVNFQQEKVKIIVGVQNERWGNLKLKFKRKNEFHPNRCFKKLFPKWNFKYSSFPLKVLSI